MNKLIARFNNKDEEAFEEVYSLIYRELNIYSSMLFRSTELNANDVLQDLFVKLWTSNQKFNDIINIKAYAYTAIKNRFATYLTHNSVQEKYREFVINNGCDSYVIETEIYSTINEALGHLPERYAQVIEMYIDGWKPSEIAAKLNKTEQSIYNIKQESIKILKSKVKSKILFSILLLIN